MAQRARSIAFVGLMSLSVVITSRLDTRADTVTDFYKGKSIAMIIPSGAGGGYDRYGRLVARHIGRFIAGNPTIIPQNMPGAGGVIAANYLYNVAPKDGTAISILENGVAFKKLLAPQQVKYDVSGLRWLGSVSPAANIAVIPAEDNEVTLKSLLKNQLIVGASGGTTFDMPLALKSLLNLKLNIVKGYNSTNDILLAMERKEVGGIIGIDYSSFVGSVKGRLQSYRVLFQMGLARHPDLKDIPLVQEIASDANEKAVLEVVFSGFAIGRSFVTTDIPEDRLIALRAAFVETMRDPKFLAEAERLGAEVNPLSPDDIAKIIASVYAKPAKVIEQARNLLAGE